MGLFDFFKREDGATAASAENDVIAALLNPDTVTKDMALEIPEIAGTIDLIAGIVAGTPIKLYKETKGKIEEVKIDNRLVLLNEDTGDTLTSNEFWRAVTRDYFLGKGGYAYINKKRNKIVSLHYVNEENIAITQSLDPIFKDFDIYVAGEKYYPWDFIRILRNTKDGAKGTPITAENSRLISVAYASLKYELNAAKRGGNKKGFLKSEKKLDEASLNALKSAFSRLYSNDTESSEPFIVLNGGIDFKESSNTLVEMQLNENKLTNAKEFAKLFHVSPEAVSGGQAATSTIAKLAAIPLMKVIESALNRDLLLEREKSTMYFAFDTKELLKGEIEERYRAYKTALDANFMQIDEVRYLEDMEPLGLNFIKLGLQDVLYNPETKEVFTPNTGISRKLDDNALSDRSEKRANKYRNAKNGQYTFKPGNTGLTNIQSGSTIKSSPKVIGVNGKDFDSKHLPPVEIAPGITQTAIEGSKVTKVYTFAGKGTKSPLRVESWLIKQFGGKTGEWQHTTGDVEFKIKSNNKTAKVHWFQEPTVGIVKAKIKRWR